MSHVYERLATAVRSELVTTSGLEAVASDKPFLDFITELLKEFGPLLLTCFGNSAKRAVAEAKNPSLLTRVRLRLGIRRHLRDDESVNLLGDPLFRAILTVGKTLTEKDFTEMAADAA